jgi:predicted ATPase
MAPCLDVLGAGRGSVVLVAGPAGAGKTMLLAEAASLAADRGSRFLRRRGSRGAGGAARGDPGRPGLCRRPACRSRAAPRSQSPDQRTWLLGELLEALEKAAHRAPLLVMVDDLQWADTATGSAVVTLSRRLATHRVSWLLALRRGELTNAAREAVGRLEAAGASEVG